jgi:cell division protein FtsZ
VTVIAAGFDESSGTRRIAGRPATAGSNGHPASTWQPFALPDRPAEPSFVVPQPAAEPEARPAPPPPHQPVGPGADQADGPADAAGEADPHAAAADGIPAPRAGDADSDEPAGSPPADGGGVRVADGSGTRRRSVVFEEDDELDVPDFLK